ncbi:DUF5683 domain-containing protein [Cesiribacter andamanensis]|nr:DUF5683 domain-containing protein [Cesiribacter andamanensis]
MKLLLLPALLSLASLAGAQVVPADSLAPAKPLLQADSFEEIQMDPADSARLPDPRKAAFLSAVLPGMGQAYNGALWKVPLVYAGGVTFVYAVNFYNARYSESLRSLRQILYDPTITEINGRNQASYQRLTNAYRRQRDYMIILGGAFYGLHIVEAYVDAHLQTFDMDEDLSLRIRPTLIPDPTGTMVAGVRITYTFP